MLPTGIDGSSAGRGAVRQEVTLLRYRSSSRDVLPMGIDGSPLGRGGTLPRCRSMWVSLVGNVIVAS